MRATFAARSKVVACRNMRLLRKPHGWLLAAFIGFALVFAWQVTAYPRGMLMAHIDHARGHYEQKSCYPCPSRWEYRRLLKEKYGVAVTSVGSCCVSESVASYADGYNAVSTPLLIDRFGRDIFTECHTLAKNKWDEENPNQENPSQENPNQENPNQENPNQE
jgi:hypothetical protein